MFLNGVLINVNYPTGTMVYDTGNSLLAVGIDYNGSGYNAGPILGTIGKLPIVRLYNRGLSNSEVLQNYNATKGRYT